MCKHVLLSNGYWNAGILEFRVTIDLAKGLSHGRNLKRALQCEIL